MKREKEKEWREGDHRGERWWDVRESRERQGERYIDSKREERNLYTEREEKSGAVI